MGQRHKARCVILEVLYSIEVGGEANVETNLNYCSSLHNLTDDGFAFARRLFDVIRSNQAEIDNILKQHINNWDINRLAIVDKNILRLGVGEIKCFPETPVKVAIDEAIELAKTYGSADSGRFVNGILDSVCDREDLGKE
jgi:transcription antitermination factor NusB